MAPGAKDSAQSVPFVPHVMPEGVLVIVPEPVLMTERVICWPGTPVTVPVVESNVAVTSRLCVKGMNSQVPLRLSSAMVDTLHMSP